MSTPNTRREARAASVAGRLAVLLISIAVSLGFAEIVVRSFLDPPTRVRLETQPVRSDLRPRELSLTRVPDRGGLYVRSPSGLRLRPNTHAVLHDERLSGRTIDIRTNSLGYRGPEVSSKEGTRILFLGDSITFANYLDEDETFVHLVSTLGAARGYQWNTINTGVGAISLGNELAILRESGLSVEPEVVVLAFYLNDFLASPGVFVEAPSAVLGWSELARHLASWLTSADPSREPRDAPLLADVRRDLQRRFAPATGDRRRNDWKRSARAFESLVLHNARDWGGAWSEPAWHELRPLFDELARMSELHDFALAFVAFPVRFQVEAAFVDDWPQRRLAAIAASLGVPALDLLPVLRGAAGAGSGTLFYDHCHHTAYGARIVAEAIVGFLESDVFPNSAAES